MKVIKNTYRNFPQKTCVFVPYPHPTSTLNYRIDIPKDKMKAPFQIFHLNSCKLGGQASFALILNP